MRILTVNVYHLIFVAMNLLIYDPSFINRHNGPPARSRETWAQLSTHLLIRGDAPSWTISSFARDCNDIIVLLYMPMLFHPHLLDILAWLPCYQSFDFLGCPTGEESKTHQHHQQI